MLIGTMLLAFAAGRHSRWPLCESLRATFVDRRLSSQRNIGATGDQSIAAGAESLVLAYHRLLDAGLLQPDASQAAAVRALQLLQNAVLQREARGPAGHTASQQQTPTARSDSGAVTGGGSDLSTASTTASTTSTASTNPTSTSTTSTASTTASTTSTCAVSSAPTDGCTAAAAPAASVAPTVRGMYLWGPVGSGKTALMDLFCTTTQQQVQRLLQQLPPPPPPPQSLASPATDPAAATGPPEGCSATAADGDGDAAAGPGLSSSQEMEGFGGSAVRQERTGNSTRGVTRLHFHEFMQGVHGRLHEMQLGRRRVVGRSRQGLPVYRYEEPKEDPLLTAAREWGSRTAVLCLDELHVTDVADAMILSRLFGALLLHEDTAVVFTSNRPPKDLYKGGLSRKYFEPFVRLMDEHMVVARVAADVDYRRTAKNTTTAAATTTTPEAAAAAAPTSATVGPPAGGWYVGPSSSESLRTAWRQRTTEQAASCGNDNSGGGSAAESRESGSSRVVAAVEVPLAYGRTIKVPYACGDAALVSFEQLCGSSGLRADTDEGGALGPPDFLALCRRFKEFYVEGVPQLGPTRRDEARRLVTFLDVAYDNRCHLVVSSDVAADALFAPLLEEARRQGVNTRLGLPKSGTASSPSTASKAASTQHKQQSGAGPSPNSGAVAGTGKAAPPPAPPGPSPPGSPAAPAPFPSGDLEVPRAVLGEEVLMYHRAASRLAEMCVRQW